MNYSNTFINVLLQYCYYLRKAWAEYCAGVQPLEAPNSFSELELSRLCQRVNQGSKHCVQYLKIKNNL